MYDLLVKEYIISYIMWIDVNFKFMGKIIVVNEKI